MKISNDIKYVGVNDRNLDLFEGQYVVENGMAYNSYVIIDEKVAVMDSVDRSFGAGFSGQTSRGKRRRRFAARKTQPVVYRRSHGTLARSHHDLRRL